MTRTSTLVKGCGRCWCVILSPSSFSNTSSAVREIGTEGPPATASEDWQPDCNRCLAGGWQGRQDPKPASGPRRAAFHSEDPAAGVGRALAGMPRRGRDGSGCDRSARGSESGDVVYVFIASQCLLSCATHVWLLADALQLTVPIAKTTLHRPSVIQRATLSPLPVLVVLVNDITRDDMGCCVIRPSSSLISLSSLILPLRSHLTIVECGCLSLHDIHPPPRCSRDNS